MVVTTHNECALHDGVVGLAKHRSGAKEVLAGCLEAVEKSTCWKSLAFVGPVMGNTK